MTAAAHTGSARSGSARSSWTGGQYSLFRVGLALGIAAVFAARLAGAPALAGLGLAGCGLLAAGWGDRTAAVGLAALWLAALGSTPALLVVPLVLAVHAWLPPAPYGSWAARGRTDPDGGWQLGLPLSPAAWLALVALYGLAAWGGDAGHWLPLGLCGLAALPRARPWAWAALVVLELVLALAHGGPALLGRLALLALAFEPGWIAPRRAGPATLYYDGECGLCHRSVRFVLAEDRDAWLRLSPLQSPAAQARLGDAERAGLPDSIVLAVEGEPLAVRSAAFVTLCEGLGGVWGALGRAVSWLPGSLTDALYDRIAAVRRRVFRAPKDLCPLMPPELRGRFVLDAPGPRPE